MIIRKIKHGKLTNNGLICLLLLGLAVLAYFFFVNIWLQSLLDSHLTKNRDASNLVSSKPLGPKSIPLEIILPMLNHAMVPGLAFGQNWDLVTNDDLSQLYSLYQFELDSQTQPEAEEEEEMTISKLRFESLKKTFYNEMINNSTSHFDETNSLISLKLNNKREFKQEKLNSILSNLFDKYFDGNNIAYRDYCHQVMTNIDWNIFVNGAHHEKFNIGFCGSNHYNQYLYTNLTLYEYSSNGTLDKITRNMYFPYLEVQESMIVVEDEDYPNVSKMKAKKKRKQKQKQKEQKQQQEQNNNHNNNNNNEKSEKDEEEEEEDVSGIGKKLQLLLIIVPPYTYDYPQYMGENFQFLKSQVGHFERLVKKTRLLICSFNIKRYGKIINVLSYQTQMQAFGKDFAYVRCDIPTELYPLIYTMYTNDWHYTPFYVSLIDPFYANPVNITMYNYITNSKAIYSYDNRNKKYISNIIVPFCPNMIVNNHLSLHKNIAPEIMDSLMIDYSYRLFSKHSSRGGGDLDLNAIPNLPQDIIHSIETRKQFDENKKRKISAWKPKHKIGACLIVNPTAIYYWLDATNDNLREKEQITLRIHEWLEYNIHILGVEHFYVYDHITPYERIKQYSDPAWDLHDSLNPSALWQNVFLTYLDTYGTHEFLSKFTYIPWIVNFTEIWTFQFSMINSCVKRFQYDNEWLLMTDFDEFIIPMNEYNYQYASISQAMYKEKQTKLDISEIVEQLEDDFEIERHDYLTLYETIERAKTFDNDYSICNTDFSPYSRRTEYSDAFKCADDNEPIKNFQKIYQFAFQCHRALTCSNNLGCDMNKNLFSTFWDRHECVSYLEDGGVEQYGDLHKSLINPRKIEYQFVHYVDTWSLTNDDYSEFNSLSKLYKNKVYNFEYTRNIGSKWTGYDDNNVFNAVRETDHVVCIHSRIKQKPKQLNLKHYPIVDDMRIYFQKNILKNENITTIWSNDVLKFYEKMKGKYGDEYKYDLYDYKTQKIVMPLHKNASHFCKIFI